jgi:hypothetical protein
VKAQQVWMKKILDSYGGQNKFYEFFTAVKAQIDAVDEIQTKEIQNVSRMLHAHLMTECFLTRYLQYVNPQLEPLKNASLSYSQKIDLINSSDDSVAFLVSGLRCLESIRNRLAYDPAIIVTDRDKKVFLSVPLFKGVKDKLLPKTGRSRQEEPMLIMECFATFAGIMLCNASSPDKRILVEFCKHQKSVSSSSPQKRKKTRKRQRHFSA